MSDFIEEPANKISLSMRKPVRGIGINDSDYNTSIMIDGKRAFCPFYTAWHNMLERCYSEEYQHKHPTYRDCTVCKDWIVFSNFKDWMQKQDWKNKQLDKDLKYPGNKIYNPDTCLFIDRYINTMFNDSKSSRGDYPQGVFLHNQTKKYIAQCSVYGKNKGLGSFETPFEAHEAYKEFKYDVILKTASLPENAYIREYLLNQAQLLTGGNNG